MLALMCERNACAEGERIDARLSSCRRLVRRTRQAQATDIGLQEVDGTFELAEEGYGALIAAAREGVLLSLDYDAPFGIQVHGTCCRPCRRRRSRSRWAP